MLSPSPPPVRRASSAADFLHHDTSSSSSTSRPGDAGGGSTWLQIISPSSISPSESVHSAPSCMRWPSSSRVSSPIPSAGGVERLKGESTLSLGLPCGGNGGGSKRESTLSLGLPSGGFMGGVKGESTLSLGPPLSLGAGEGGVIGVGGVEGENSIGSDSFSSILTDSSSRPVSPTQTTLSPEVRRKYWTRKLIRMKEELDRVGIGFRQAGASLRDSLESLITRLSPARRKDQSRRRSYVVGGASKDCGVKVKVSRDAGLVGVGGYSGGHKVRRIRTDGCLGDELDLKTTAMLDGFHQNLSTFLSIVALQDGRFTADMSLENIPSGHTRQLRVGDFRLDINIARKCGGVDEGGGGGEGGGVVGFSWGGRPMKGNTPQVRCSISCPPVVPRPAPQVSPLSPGSPSSQVAEHDGRTTRGDTTSPGRTRHKVQATDNNNQGGKGVGASSGNPPSPNGGESDVTPLDPSTNPTPLEGARSTTTTRGLSSHKSHNVLHDLCGISQDDTTTSRTTKCVAVKTSTSAAQLESTSIASRTAGAKQPPIYCGRVSIPMYVDPGSLLFELNESGTVLRVEGKLKGYINTGISSRPLSLSVNDIRLAGSSGVVGDQVGGVGTGAEEGRVGMRLDVPGRVVTSVSDRQLSRHDSVVSLPQR